MHTRNVQRHLSGQKSAVVKMPNDY